MWFHSNCCSVIEHLIIHSLRILSSPDFCPGIAVIWYAYQSRHWLYYTEHWQFSILFLYPVLPDASSLCSFMYKVSVRKKKKVFIFRGVEVHFNCFWIAFESDCGASGGWPAHAAHPEETRSFSVLWKRILNFSTLIWAIFPCICMDWKKFWKEEKKKEEIEQGLNIFCLSYYFHLSSSAPLSLPPILHQTDKLFGSSWGAN